MAHGGPDGGARPALRRPLSIPDSRFPIPDSDSRYISPPMAEPIPFPSAMTPVRRALLSVHGKSGGAELPRELASRGVRLVSTGGTAAHLKEAGLDVTLVEEETGFPEILGGRGQT